MDTIGFLGNITLSVSTAVAENRISGGVGGITGAIPLPRPNRLIKCLVNLMMDVYTVDSYAKTRIGMQFSTKREQLMKILKKLARLPRVAAYNRDWRKYLKVPAVDADHSVETFRLRNGQVLQVKNDARFILNEIYLDRVYDMPGVSYSKLINVLDLGANVGLYATYVSSQNPTATIYCFEPSNSNYQILKYNIRRNNVNAKLYQAAVSVEKGTGFLSKQKSSVEYSLVNQPDVHTEEVQCVGLDQIFSLCGVERFDLLKIDIEGHEKILLENASDEWLLHFDHLIIEWHYSWEELERVAQRLRAIGFETEKVLLEKHMRFLRASRVYNRPDKAADPHRSSAKRVDADADKVYPT